MPAAPGGTKASRLREHGYEVLEPALGIDLLNQATMIRQVVNIR
jgi:hypothetical protein